MPPIACSIPITLESMGILNETLFTTFKEVYSIAKWNKPPSRSPYPP